MENTISLIEQRDKIQRAASFQSEVVDGNIIGYDTYNNLVKIMTARREIAIALLKETDVDKCRSLLSVYEYFNEDIKKLLGL